MTALPRARLSGYRPYNSQYRIAELSLSEPLNLDPWSLLLAEHRLPVIDASESRLFVAVQAGVELPEEIPLRPAPIPSAWRAAKTRPLLLLADDRGLLQAAWLVRRRMLAELDCHSLILAAYQPNELFRPQPSVIMVPGIAAHITATAPLFDDLGVPCRFASDKGLPGCFDGEIGTLAETWLHYRQQAGLGMPLLAALGAAPIRKTADHLARRFDLEKLSTD